MNGGFRMNIRTASAARWLGPLVLLGIAACSEPAAEAPPPPPPAEPVNETVHQFRIGGMTGVALRDGSLGFPNDNQVLGVGRTREEVAEVLTAEGLPTDSLSLSLQPLLVKAGGRVMLFDTGAGSNMGDGAGKLHTALAEAGVTADAVTDIFISHMHGDHIGGLLDAAGEPAFANATIRMSAPEWEALRAQSQNRALALAIEPDVSTFQPGAQVLPGMVRAVEVKGHTPGHSAYRIGTGASSLLYIGDSMHHHVISVQKPEWTIAFDTDAAAGAASRATLLADVAASGQRIHAVHFPFPGLGKIEKRGEGYVWVAE